MKSLMDFLLETLKTDEQEVKDNKRITDLEFAFSFSNISCNFEIECFVSSKKPIYIGHLTDKVMLSYYKELGKEISKVFKTKNIYTDTHYHGTEKQFKIDHPQHWFLEMDNSLDTIPPKLRYFPVEIITPWVLIKDANDFIKKFKTEVFDQLSGYTNKVTGLHINFRTPSSIINPLKILLLLDEDKELSSFLRQNSEFAAPHIHELIGSIKNNETIKDIIDILNPDEYDQLTKLAIKYIKLDKHRTVNFKDYNFNNGTGRVEIRIIGNDYFGSSLYNKTLTSINKYITYIASSTDKDLHKQELVQNFNKKFNMSVEPFIVRIINDFNKRKTIDQLHNAELLFNTLRSAISNELSAVTFEKVKTTIEKLVFFIPIKSNITLFNNKKTNTIWSSLVSNISDYSKEHYVVMNNINVLSYSDIVNINEDDIKELLDNLLLLRDNESIIRFIQGNKVNGLDFKKLPFFIDYFNTLSGEQLNLMKKIIDKK